MARIVLKADHIVDLERRQKALEKEIAEALTHTSPDDLMIIDLKRRMLHLRDELGRLRDEAVRHGRHHQDRFVFSDWLTVRELARTNAGSHHSRKMTVAATHRLTLSSISIETMRRATSHSDNSCGS